MSNESHEAMRRDAERYRWLRDGGVTVLRTKRRGEKSEHIELHSPEVWARRATLDEVVDVAMRSNIRSRAA